MNIGDFGEGIGRTKIKNKNKDQRLRTEKRTEKIVKFYQFGYSFDITNFIKFEYAVSVSVH